MSLKKVPSSNRYSIPDPYYFTKDLKKFKKKSSTVFVCQCSNFKHAAIMKVHNVGTVSNFDKIFGG